MSARELVDDIASALAARGIEEIELYQKEGRTRRLELGPQGKLTTFARESGWALRATGERASFLAQGTGRPRVDGPWPEADGYPLKLPAAQTIPAWTEPEDLEAPLAVENESLGLLETFERELKKELPGARVLKAVLEDGASQVEVTSTRGVACGHRARGAAMWIEMVGPEPSVLRLTELYAEREARKFRPQALARRLADRLVLLDQGKPAERDRGEFVLAPRIGAEVLRQLRPLLVGPRAQARARDLAGSGDRLASAAVTIVDDPRLAEGLFVAPVDGEGIPTRRLELVSAGILRRPLLAWWQTPGGESGAAAPAGCVRRPGWRDLPRLGPSHLFIAPDPRTSASQMLSDVARGYYFTEVVGAANFRISENRFELPVAGFRVSGGSPTGRISRAVLQGRLTSLLGGVQRVGRDLRFFPAADSAGSPSLLVTGVELGRI